MMETIKARFGIGEIVQHSLFGYRGVIVDADAGFQGDDAWDSKNAPGNPPKNQPWYHILVHGSVHHAYAAEMNLSKDDALDPVEHPELDYFFDSFKDGLYHRRRSSN